MRGERGEPRRQGPLAADQDPHDGRPQIVVGDTRGRPVKVRKGADVPVEKADLILALVDPSKVAARVHQPHQEQPRFAARPVEIYEDLEEIDLGQVARPIRQRHEDLAPLPLPLRHGLFDDGDADAEPLSHQQGMEAGRRQPLLTRRPLRRTGQQRLDALSHLVPHRSCPRCRCLPTRDRLADVFPDRQPRNPELFGDLPPRPAFHEHLVPNDMYLVHPEHPPSGPEAQRFGNRDQALRWITFRAANGSLSERRAHSAWP